MQRLLQLTSTKPSFDLACSLSHAVLLTTPHTFHIPGDLSFDARQQYQLCYELTSHQQSQWVQHVQDL